MADLRSICSRISSVFSLTHYVNTSSRSTANSINRLFPLAFDTGAAYGQVHLPPFATMVSEQKASFIGSVLPRVFRQHERSHNSRKEYAFSAHRRAKGGAVDMIRRRPCRPAKVQRRGLKCSQNQNEETSKKTKHYSSLLPC